MPILKRKCTKSACTLKRIQKRKSLKIPINKDFSGKKEDTDIVSISASFVGGGEGNRTPVRKLADIVFSERSHDFGIPLTERLAAGFRLR